MNLNHSFIALYTLSLFDFFKKKIEAYGLELHENTDFANAKNLILSNDEEVILPKSFEKIAHTVFSTLAIREARFRRLGKKVEEEAIRKQLETLERNSWSYVFGYLKQHYCYVQAVEGLEAKAYKDELKAQIYSLEKDIIYEEWEKLIREGTWKGEANKEEQVRQKQKGLQLNQGQQVKPFDSVLDDGSLMAVSKAALVTMLFKQSSRIIREYFPVEEWGLPSHKLIEFIMNMIMGNNIVAINEAEPFVHTADDLYGLKENLLIDCLVNKLKEFGVHDPLKELENTGIYEDIDTLMQILQKAPSVAIRQDPFAYKSRKREGGRTAKLEDELLEAAMNMVEVDKENYSIQKMEHKFETYKKYSDQYLKPMVNQGKRLQELLEGVKGIPRKGYIYKINEIIKVTRLYKIPECNSALQDLMEEFEIINKREMESKIKS